MTETEYWMATLAETKRHNAVMEEEAKKSRLALQDIDSSISGLGITLAP